MHPRLKHLAVGWLLAVTLALCREQRAEAVVVLKKGVAAPLMGHLVRADERTVVVRQELEGGKSRDVVIPRSEIDEYVETVSPQRLAELHPAQPSGYLEYAEELAEKRRDPEARDTARRLLTIAASRGDAALRQSSLRVLVELARSEEERRRIAALIFLTGPHHEAEVLSTDSVVANEPDSSARHEALTALRLIRQGQGATAKGLLEKKPVQEELARGELKMTPAELTALAAERSLDAEQLARILRAELALEPGSSSPASGQARPWSRAVRSQALTPVLPLSSERLTEFDPSESVFRGGKWQQP